MSGCAQWVTAHLFTAAGKNTPDLLPASAPLPIFLASRESVSRRRKQTRSSQHQLKDCQLRMERKILGSADGLCQSITSRKTPTGLSAGRAVPAHGTGQSGPATSSTEAPGAAEQPRHLRQGKPKGANSRQCTNGSLSLDPVLKMSLKIHLLPDMMTGNTISRAP